MSIPKTCYRLWQNNNEASIMDIRRALDMDTLFRHDASLMNIGRALDMETMFRQIFHITFLIEISG